MGNVNIITVFLKCNAFDWSESTKDAYYACVRKAADYLISEAARYGVHLNIRCMHLETKVSANANPRKGYDLVKDYFHCSTMEELQNYYKENMGVDEVPISVVLSPRL